MSKIRVVGWVSYDEAEWLLAESVGGCGGAMDTLYTRRRLLREFYPHARPYLSAIFRALDGLAPTIVTGDAHQAAYVPVFSDGTCARFSMRAWGDVVSAWWNDRYPDAPWNYCAFAWMGDGPSGTKDEAETLASARESPQFDPRDLADGVVRTAAERALRSIVEMLSPRP